MEFATKHFLTNIANKIPSLFSPFNYPIVFYYTCASMSPCRKICLQAIHIHWIINIALLKIYCIFSRICITIDKIYPSHILSSSCKLQLLFNIPMQREFFVAIAPVRITLVVVFSLYHMLASPKHIVLCTYNIKQHVSNVYYLI